MQSKLKLTILTVITIVAVVASALVYVRSSNEVDYVSSEPSFLTESVGGEYSFELPTTFTLMDEGLRKEKYPQGVVNVWSSPNNEANIVINETPLNTGASDINVFKQTIKDTFGKLYPDIVWGDERERLINGRKSILLEFKANNQNNYMVIVKDGNSWKMISFNYSFGLEGQWSDLGHKVIDSLIFPGKEVEASSEIDENDMGTVAGDDPVNIPSDFTFSDQTLRIGMGMTKGEIDALLGTPTAYTNAARLEIYEYENCEIFYRNDRAVYIQSHATSQEKHLQIGDTVKIGDPEINIINKYGEPTFINQPKAKIAGKTIFYVMLIEGDKVEKLPSMDSAIGKEDVYIINFIVRDNKIEMIAMQDYQFATNMN